MPDRIEAGTFALMTASSGGKVMLKGRVPQIFLRFFIYWKERGAVSGNQRKAYWWKLPDKKR